MIYFHNMSATTIELDALKLARRKRLPVNICLSAYTYETESHTKKKHSMLRNYADLLMLDSGFKSAVKYDKKKKTDVMRSEWMDKTKRIAEIGEVISADIVSMLDIPLDAFDFGRDSWYIQKELNFSLACKFSEVTMKPRKIYILQGYLPEDYLECYMKYRDLLTPLDWVGIGRQCAYFPKRLAFEVLTQIRKRCDYHIHVFGVTSRRYLAAMRQIGIDSADGSAGFRAAMKVTGVKRDRVKRTFEIIENYVEC